MTEQIKERPILFSGPMVQAILDGKKTQTRRVMKPQPCPYGQKGDRLWVREAFAEVHPCQIDEGRYSRPSPAGIPGPPPVSYRTIYRADGDYPHLHFTDGYPYRERCTPNCKHDHSMLHPEETFNGWSPSIYMPRRCSRITLEITEIRIQRVQDISEEDAEAEGVECFDPENDAPVCRVPGLTDWDYSFAQEAFRFLWDSINAARGYGWESNPFVWAISFRRI